MSAVIVAGEILASRLRDVRSRTLPKSSICSTLPRRQSGLTRTLLRCTAVGWESERFAPTAASCSHQRRALGSTARIGLQDADFGIFGSEEIIFASQLLGRYKDQLQDGGPREDHKKLEASRAIAQTGLSSTRESKSLQGNPFSKALEAMQQQDSRRLLIYLKQIVELPFDMLVKGVQALPRTTLSEFLRSLDPLEMSSRNDPSHGFRVGPGMWQVLNLENMVDQWGTKKLYTKVLRSMITLLRALQSSGHIASVNDYIPLLRAAGAASDIEGATLLWKQMEELEVRQWRNHDAYHEFIKARFLLDPIYYSHDKTRIVMTARNMDRRRGIRLYYSRHRLEKLWLMTRRRAGLFGNNKSLPIFQDLSRTLRKDRPTTRLFINVIKSGARMSKDILYDFMRAFGRAGSYRYMQVRILNDYFGIRINKNGDFDQTLVESTSTRSRLPKDKLRPPVPIHEPDAGLIRAVVDAYCPNGNIHRALTIIEHISDTYRIPIDPEVWFEILEWIHVLSCPPVSTGWRMAGMSHRVPKATAVEMVWKAMTSEPHNIRPGFKQYDFLISSLISRSRHEDALEYMRQARVLYDEQCKIHADAAFEYIHVLRDGMNLTESFQAFHKARFAKQQMWYRLRFQCRRLLKLYSKTGRNGPCVIPDFVKEWREFVPNPTVYRTMTGYVQLLDPAADRIYVTYSHSRRENTVVYRRTLPFPLRHGGGKRQVREFIKTWVALGSHSLADHKTSKGNPWVLLSGELDAVRTRIPRAVSSDIQGDSSVGETDATSGKVAPYDDDDD